LFVEETILFRARAIVDGDKKSRNPPGCGFS
jgi:hypothetical protein